ncbi:hypothetical protein FRC02_000418 [Tulasnella sp. 418]|nr:hypothetical protein FRC02_000418 [Tulasnella sp. 418]
MSGHSSLQTDSRSASPHASLISPHTNSDADSTPPGDRQPRPSNVHPLRTSHSVSKSTGILNDDVEKQLSGADRAVDGEVDLENTPPQTQGDQEATFHNLSAPPDPNKNGPSNLDQYADFWDVYNNVADKEDNELIKSFAGNLDTLLIFAGLFSVTNTVFIVESYKDLKQDPSELTNNLLRNMMRTIHQSSFTEADLLLDYAGPPTRAIVVNLFFFASLCCSLFTAFGAVIGKQWLNHYGRESQLRSPSDRGIERHRKYVGLEKWKFQAVVETLPTLLQFSLFFFFIGLIDFMWPLNIAVGILIILLSVLTLSFYVVTLLIGILYPNSPFQTRLTNVLRKRLPKNLALGKGQDTQMDILRARCVDWLQQRTAFSETVGMIHRAITLLTDDAKKAINLDGAGAMLAYLLRSSFSNKQAYLGISADGLQSSLILLRDAISQWDKDSDIVHTEDTRNASFLQVLDRELWNLLLKTGTMDEIETSTTLGILEKLGPVNWGGSRDSHATYLIESLGKPLTRQGQLAGLTLLTDALWSDGQDWLYGGVGAYVTNIHMREVLSTTMWGVDGKPDLDDQRVVLRLSWFLDDTDGMHPQIQGRDFDRYLSLWLKSDVRPNPSVPFEPVFRGLWYLRTLIRLLLHDQERWAKQLDEHGHLAHIEAILLDTPLMSSAQLLAFIMFAYVAGRNDDPNAPPSQYYSQERVDRVVQQLRYIEVPWFSDILGKFQPNRVDLINQSL